MAGIDLGFAPTPDWRRLAQSLQRGEPERVPLYELTIAFTHVEAILGRPRPTEAEDKSLDAWARFRTDFYHKAGYDFVGIGTLLEFPKQAKRVEAGTTTSTARSGIIHDRQTFAAYDWPVVRDEHLAHGEACARILPAGMKIRPRVPAVLASAINLMGFEGLGFALADDPELVGMVTEAIGLRAVELAGRYAAHPDIDFITLADDMGFRTGTMISPAALREYVFPWHRRVAEAIHSEGKVAILHSDGNLEAVMDDVIACGWDARHSVEDAIMTAPEMKRRWGDRIAICGAVDVDVLARSTPEQVRDRTRALIAECAPGGGWALGSGNAVSEYVPIGNYLAMLHAALLP